MFKHHKRRVLEDILRAVSDGLIAGYNKAHKHTDNPGDEEIIAKQDQYIKDNLWEIPEFADFFSFDEEEEEV